MQLQQFLPYQLSILSNKISKGIAKFYQEKHGITIPEWRVLVILSTLKKLNAKELAYHSQMDKVKISRTMKILESKGLISEKKCKQDGRARKYNLTKSGQQLINEVKPQAMNFENILLSSMNNDEIKTLQKCISALNQQVDNMSGQKKET